MGEEGDEDGVGEQSLTARDALAEVDEVGDLGEGKEADAEGEDDIGKGVVDEVVGREEVEQGEEVFEVRQQQEIGDDGGDQPTGAGGFREAVLQAQRKEEVHEDGGGEEDEIGGIPVAVEEEGDEGEPGEQGGTTKAGEELITGKGDREVEEEEDAGGEEHQRASFRRVWI